jgi:hypothetical protein
LRRPTHLAGEGCERPAVTPGTDGDAARDGDGGGEREVLDAPHGSHAEWRSRGEALM